MCIRGSNYATASFGQGIWMTSIQLIRAYSALANGGVLVRPSVAKIKQEETPPARQVIDPETSKTIAKMLASVVDNGFGKSAKIKGYSIAGKTGTAEKIVDGRYSKTENVSSFVGMFPADKPEIGIIVVLDNPHPLRTGGVTAGPVFAEIAAPSARYMDIPSMDAEDWVYYEPTQAEAP